MFLHFYHVWILVVTLGLNIVKCTEFVPVYIWETQRNLEDVPALHKISEESFKDFLSSHVKKNTKILVFAEETLSPEDFAQHDENGDVVFNELSNLKQKVKVSYRPYIQNPIGAIKQLGKTVTEVSIGSLLKTDVPKSDVLIISLNDAREDEQRTDMLKRHDQYISKLYNELLEDNENILAIYTGRHTSWVIPEELHIHRKTRTLLESKDDVPEVYNSTDLLLYVSGPILLVTEKDGKKTTEVFKVNSVSSSSNSSSGVTEITATISTNATDITIIYVQYTTVSYWSLAKITVDKNIFLPNVSVPNGFSYACDTSIRSISKTASIVIPDFQSQPFVNETVAAKFGDAYNCVGFTTIAIWSGIFTSFILLLILSLGLTVMMDIKTMDRFDDPKGKLISFGSTD